MPLVDAEVQTDGQDHRTATKDAALTKESKRKEQPLVGHWVDESHSWYDGSIIEFNDDDTWRPLKPKQKVHQTAHYTCNVLSKSEWDLFEVRADGDERRFKVLLDEETKGLQVQYMRADGTLADLKWHLMASTPGQQAQKKRIQDILDVHSAKNTQGALQWECTLDAVYNNSLIVVGHNTFDALVGFVIILNSICIGVEIDQSIDRLPDDVDEYLWTLEYFFLFFYISELSIRFLAHGKLYLKEPWGILDIVLVTLGVVVIPLKAIKGMDGWLLKRIMIFRIVRLVRIQQFLRTIEIMQPLWKLINGITNAMGTLASTMLVIFFVLYIFACIGGELVSRNTDLRWLAKLTQDDFDNALPGELGYTKAHQDAAVVVRENFNRVSVIMLTLVQFTTADITDIYFPLIKTEPYLVFYFGGAYLIITILLMNLVTAVLVEDAIARSSEDTKMKARKTRRKLDSYIPQLEAIFDEVDHDGTGDINLTELAGFVPKDGMNLDQQVLEVMRPETLEECYECFDADNSGLVSKEEFVQGALAVLLKDAPQELTQLLQLVRASNKQLIAIQERLDAMEIKFQ